MKKKESVLGQILELMAPLAPAGVNITGETDLVGDLSLDSLKVMKILESLEDTFDISIPINILPDVRTVKDLADQIEKLTGNGV